MPVEGAISERPLTIADLPEWLPAVLGPIYDLVLPDLLGGDPVILPARMPSGLRLLRPAELAAALALQRPPRTGRATPVTACGPALAGFRTQPGLVHRAATLRIWELERTRT